MQQQMRIQQRKQVAQEAQEKGHTRTTRPIPGIPIDSNNVPSRSGLSGEHIARVKRVEPRERVRQYINNDLNTLRQETHTVLEFVKSSQQRNETFNRELLRHQFRLEGEIGKIYRQTIKQEGEILLPMLAAIQQVKVEQTKIDNTVQSLRHWARAVQRYGLPVDKSLRDAILSLSMEDLAVSQYFEVNLPLIPSIISYKAEVHHMPILQRLWQEIKGWIGL